MNDNDLLMTIVSLTPEVFAKAVAVEQYKAAGLLTVEAAIHLVVSECIKMNATQTASAYKNYIQGFKLP